MNRVINPYNLSEQVKINTKKIQDNIEDIDALYQVIDTIPDVSGFYTKTETDLLLLTKLNSTNLLNNEEAKFYYSTQNSPSITKINTLTNNGTQLRLLTDSIAINSIINGNLDYFTPRDLADITTKKYVDENLALKANSQDLTLLTNEINEINENLETLNPKVEELENNVNINTQNISSNTNNIALNLTKINQNTSSIETLNNLVEQSFSSFGSYTSPSGRAEDTTVRPILTENIPLDPQFVTVTTGAPNLFINHNDGKIIFTISLSNLTNEGTNLATLSMNIFYNGEIVSNPAVDIPIGWSGSRVVTGALTVEAESEVYFEFVVNNILSVDAPIQYNIEFNNSSLISSPSSAIVNDKIENPNLGINPDLNTISSNTTRISKNETDIQDLYSIITSLQTNINNTLPIGTIIISSSQPLYGTWSDLGLLNEGQAIIGGNSSDGIIQRHNHKTGWLSRVNNLRDDNKDMANGWIGYNSNYESVAENVRSGAYTGNNLFYTYVPELNGEETNSVENKAYGLGIGEGMHLWKRTG